MFGQNILGPKIFWSRIILVKIFLSKTNFDEKKFLVKKIVCEKKNVCSKKCLVKKSSCSNVFFFVKLGLTMGRELELT